MGRSRGGDGGNGGGGPEASARPVRLPDLMHITQTETIVSFEDSTGVPLEEITTIGVGQDTLVHAPGAQVVRGEWKDGKLVAERPGPRGGKVTQTIDLEEAGKVLIVETKLDLGGDTPARTIKRVYRTAGES